MKNEITNDEVNALIEAVDVLESESWSVHQEFRIEKLKSLLAKINRCKICVDDYHQPCNEITNCLTIRATN